MDRYFTLKYPMKYGRNKTKTMVVLKIMFVWVVSISICSPLCIYGFLDYGNVYNDLLCVPTLENFVMYGSVFAFYVPLFIMVITYVLTIQILCNNQKLMQSIAREQVAVASYRKERNGASQMYATSHLSPATPRYLDRPSLDTSITYNLASGDQSTLDSPKDDNVTSDSGSKPDMVKTQVVNENGIIHETIIPQLSEPTPEPSLRSYNGSRLCVEEMELDNQEQCEQFLCTLGSSPMRCSLSVSQPHLPSMEKGREQLSPSYTRHSLKLPRTQSHHSVYDLESVKNFASLSLAGSINSMASQSRCDSTVWSEFNDEPEMFEKLSQIEQEMDECLLLDKSAAKHSNMNLSVSLSSGSLASSEKSSDNAVDSDESHQSAEGAECGQVPVTSTIDVPAVSVMISAPSGSGSDCSLDRCMMPAGASRSGSESSNAGSEQSGLVTIRIKASGCYLYQVQEPPAEPDTQSICSRTQEQDSPLLKNAQQHGASVSGEEKLNNHVNQNEESPKQAPTMREVRGRRYDTERCDSTDEALSDAMSQSTVSTYYKFSPKLNPKHQVRLLSRTGTWRNVLSLRRKNNKFILNGHVHQVISKRTASNEKKASKVLGIIFAVFVVLWTPFFIMNILSVACKPCLLAITPPMMASITWLGWLSSLANPIVYTMFNTAFRRAFYRILTCRYSQEHEHKRTPSQKRSSNASTNIKMTNAATWVNTVTSSDRRNTVTATPAANQ